MSTTPPAAHARFAQQAPRRGPATLPAWPGAPSRSAASCFPAWPWAVGRLNGSVWLASATSPALLQSAALKAPAASRDARRGLPGSQRFQHYMRTCPDTCRLPACLPPAAATLVTTPPREHPAVRCVRQDSTRPPMAWVRPLACPLRALLACHALLALLRTLPAHQDVLLPLTWLVWQRHLLVTTLLCPSPACLPTHLPACLSACLQPSRTPP